MTRNLSFLGTVLLLGTGPALAQLQGKVLAGQALYRPVQTVEGPVSQPVAVENAPFCVAYRCVGANSLGNIQTGELSWYVVPRGSDEDEILKQSEAGGFYPELTVHYKKNVVTFTDLMFDTAVRKTLPAGTLNLLGNFTRLVLGAPISGQKLSACYRTLQTEARCTVGGGKIKTAGGTPRTFKAWFRTVDDGAGYAHVNYAIELED